MLIRRQVRRLRGLALAVTVTAVALTSAGCDGGGDNGPKDRAAGGGSVVAPGKPGEPARTLSASQAAKAAAGVDTPNSADVRYVRMMIEHHAQALVLTRLVPARSGSDAVKRVAERITAAQQPEIGAMKGWLSRHGRTEEADGHDHGAMPGMATDAQLDQLRAAKGKAFDQLFLKLMITHHQGAVTMATEALSEGNNIQVEEMADDVVAQQTTEISRMRALSS